MQLANDSDSANSLADCIWGDDRVCVNCGHRNRSASDDARRNCGKPAPAFGPGTELTKLLHELGLRQHAGCDCPKRARQMDQWGVEGCIANRETIIGWLEESAAKASWGEWWTAGRKAASLGIFSIPMLVDEAIRRASESPPSAQTH